ncbi:MAG: TIM-barrel domain-containing protein [Flavisolibacter sp.]
MKERTRILAAILSVLIFLLDAHAGDFKKTADGVIVYPDSSYAGGVHALRLYVINENIIRVHAYAQNSEPENNSLIILSGLANKVKFEVRPDHGKVRLITSKVAAIVDLRTGQVSFEEASGKRILREEMMGRIVTPAVFDGKSLYHIRQNFQTQPDDAWYGLGQHQDGLMNYKGNQVQLFQNNTEVAVPFLLSRKNYGILWDNYSLTAVGDLRPYQEIHQLQLFSKNGEEGWLTASYSNDRNHPEQVAVERPESSIDLAYLNDSKLFLPADFKPQNGVVHWEGSIASSINGIHKFRFTYAGYIKVWINGELLMDRWRQAWNPGSAILDVNLEPGKKYSFRIEWIPDGGESYISCKFLPPVPANHKDEFGFSSEAGTALDYYFISGKNMDSVISGYRYLTGKAVILPLWAFGKWQSRERYKTENELLDVAAEFRKRKIPLDNIVLDWNYWREPEWGSQQFDPSRFPSPDSMIRALHLNDHLHFMISVWPKFYEGISTYKYFDSKGWLYKRNIANRQRDWIAQGYVSTFYDAFNVEAQKGFWDLINQHLYSKGVDAWWMDASEPDILSNVNPQKRKEEMTPTALGPSAEFLNAYPMENARGIYEGQRASNPNARVFILTRSAFAGSQRYAAATWSGDISSRWHEMKNQISAGVNFSMSGIPYWTMDIGGFAVERRFEHLNDQDLDEWRELMTRWYQFGAFVPLFRVHGQFPYREIFNIAPESHPAYQSMLFYDHLRYRLLPYIYSLAGKAWQNNYTLMRGLVMNFPGDSIAANRNDEYLFGPSLLVAPVYQYGERKKEVYLPEGSGWYDLYSGKYFIGAQKLQADAPYERMPVFVREGSILPFGPELQYTNEKPADTIHLFVYTGRNASFELYEDEGTNYNYEKGMYSNIRMDYDENKQTLTIADRKGNFPGMLQKRIFIVSRVSSKAPVEWNPDRSGTVVSYEGKKIIINLKP